MIKFVYLMLGLIFGNMMGITLMCILQINRINELAEK